MATPIPCKRAPLWRAVHLLSLTRWQQAGTRCLQTPLPNPGLPGPMPCLPSAPQKSSC